MNFTIKSRKTGEIFNFFAPDNAGNVRLESEGYPGTLGMEICNGGGFMGIPLSCAGTEEDLARVARRWYRQYMEAQRKMEMGY
ncbi:hypothetical protein OL397_004464 [Salmonella enterica]|nr:hypothetical protein [Salmonella enterica]